ncbi:MAG: hypothetical protein AVDCRST_MAG18-3804 [uncultured Thermomicrobiales bacterium]|uniref:Uncharacterized protein n=1 Tax=uncultured Thermomicrobiales bacterium TaxID=1645740 RepID=A0A6J4VR87_9BACT|nr:MAG: hypothetical protein AVDCRST_MAG18-3804 [uncultured Thermomicrobiales bacterium]
MGSLLTSRPPWGVVSRQSSVVSVSHPHHIERQTYNLGKRSLTTDD